MPSCIALLLAFVLGFAVCFVVTVVDEMTCKED